MKQSQGIYFSDEFGMSDITNFYEDCLITQKESASQNGWKDLKSQQTRFTQMTHSVMQLYPESICDVGCGTGDYLSYLRTIGFVGRYKGIDMSERMINVASINHSEDSNATFTTELSSFKADVTVASGIFNVKGLTSDRVWKKYVRSVIEQMWENSNLGISFNVLSKYSDEKFRKKNLYYADPKEIIEYCAQNLSDRLILDHSYDQFDMTVTVGKKIVLVSK